MGMEGRIAGFGGRNRWDQVVVSLASKVRTAYEEGRRSRRERRQSGAGIVPGSTSLDSTGRPKDWVTVLTEITGALP